MNPTVQNLLSVINSTLGAAANANPGAKIALTAAAALASILDNRFGAGSREIVVEKPTDVSDLEWDGLKQHPIMSPTVVDDTFNAALKAERSANPKPPAPPSPSYVSPSYPGPSHPAPPLPPGPSHPPSPSYVSPSYPGTSYTGPSYPGPSHPGPSRA